jgi:hypothetical protein
VRLQLTAAGRESRARLTRPADWRAALLLASALGLALGLTARAQQPGGADSAVPTPAAELEPPPAGEPERRPESSAPAAAEQSPPRPRPVRITADLRSGVYQDSDHTTVSTTTVAARAIIKDRVQLTARYLVDVVSSASVDVVTAATAGFRETRHEGTAGIGYHDGTSSIDLGYIYSGENDWWSHTIDLGLSRDFLQHNLTIGLGGSAVFNDVGRSGDRNFHRSLDVFGGSVTVAGTPSRRDVLSLSYTLSALSGYQASPYRYVMFINPQGLREVVPENVPNQRLRHALTVQWKRFVQHRSAIHLHARGYVDDWQIVSLTAGGEYLIELGEFVLSPHLRGYVQRHAGFYQAQYTQRVNFMTFDRELSTFIDGFLGLRASWARRRLGPLAELRLEAKLDGFGFYFFDFPRLQSRYGLIAELALGVSL